jgi:hypothetical protein
MGLTIARAVTNRAAAVIQPRRPPDRLARSDLATLAFQTRLLGSLGRHTAPGTAAGRASGVSGGRSVCRTTAQGS